MIPIEMTLTGNIRCRMNQILPMSIRPAINSSNTRLVLRRPGHGLSRMARSSLAFPKRRRWNLWGSAKDGW
jgi:hypothetical protein